MANVIEITIKKSATGTTAIAAFTPAKKIAQKSQRMALTCWITSEACDQLIDGASMNAGFRASTALPSRRPATIATRQMQSAN